MNSVTLIAKVDAVNIQDRGQWTSCGIKLSNSQGLDCWLEVRGLKKTGKEMEWLPKLKGHFVLVDGRFTSYEKKDNGGTVYSISASKSDLHRVTEAAATDLLERNWNGAVKLSGRVESSKTGASGEHFLKVGLRYINPSAKDKEKEVGYYYTRVACPTGFEPERHQVGSYVTVLGTLSQTPDGKPVVKGFYVG